MTKKEREQRLDDILVEHQLAIKEIRYVVREAAKKHNIPTLPPQGQSPSENAKGE